MGLKQRLSDLFWPPEFSGEQPSAKPADRPAAQAVKAAEATPGLEQPKPNVAQRLRQVGVPDPDLKDVERRQRIHESEHEAERRARREAAYEQANATCPVPIHAERLPLPGSLSLHDDEFLVAASSRTVKGNQLTLTTQRLIYTRANGEAQLVLYLADICDVAFHNDGTATLGTPSGRWDRLALAGNNLAASRDGLLSLIHHARAERTPLPGGLDELVDLRDRGAIGAAQFEARRGAATAAPRRRRQRPVEIAGKAAARTSAPADGTSTPPPPEGEPEPGEPQGG
jgi:hypothetical protein